MLEADAAQHVPARNSTRRLVERRWLCPSGGIEWIWVQSHRTRCAPGRESFWVLAVERVRNLLPDHPRVGHVVVPQSVKRSGGVMIEVHNAPLAATERDPRGDIRDVAGLGVGNGAAVALARGFVLGDSVQRGGKRIPEPWQNPSSFP